MSSLIIRVFDLPLFLCGLLLITSPSVLAQSSELSKADAPSIINYDDDQISHFNQGKSIFTTVETVDLDEDNEASTEQFNQPSSKRRWYGYKIYLAELGNVIFPFITYLVGGPIVHVFEEEYMKGLQSLLLRLIAPVAGAGSIYSICQSCPHDGGARLASIVGGIILGMVTAIVIDSSYFAYKDLSITVKPLAIASESDTVRRSVDSGVLPQPWLLNWAVKF